MVVVYGSARMQCHGRKHRTTAALAAIATVLVSGWCRIRPPLFVPVLRHALGSNSLIRIEHQSRIARSASSVSVPHEVVPLGSHLLVKIKEAEDALPGGILLSKKDKPREGQVMAVGAGEPDEDTGRLVPVSVEPGSNVIYSRFGGVDLNCGGVEHALVHDDDVLLSYSGETPTLENCKVPRGKVLVCMGQAKEKSANGLLLAKGAARDAMRVGEVVLVGEGELLTDGASKPAEFNAGDIVRFRFGDEVKLAGPDGDSMEHMLVREDDIVLSYSVDEPTLGNTKMPRGRVLVRLQKAEDESSGGLLLAKGAASDAVGVGEAVLVGGAELRKDGSEKAAEVAKGDMVRFRFGDEVKLDIGDAKFSSVRASNCIAKWKAM
mmetsp:Transcript_24586/g.56730  ORF Transcript_24586/g.56730 Transcript_24586/m.56730 type:complete len:378 (-) Transcript_24586:158-1291(-)|eukprot:1322828-Amphidinium_carterae.2